MCSGSFGTEHRPPINNSIYRIHDRRPVTRPQILHWQPPLEGCIPYLPHLRDIAILGFGNADFIPFNLFAGAEFKCRQAFTVGGFSSARSPSPM